jgi:hypothetical protein
VTGRPAALCGTFDEAPVERGFSARMEEAGGTLSLVALSTSPPTSLLVSVPADSPKSRAFLVAGAGRPTSFISAAASMQYASVSVSTTALQLGFGPDEVKIRITPTGTSFRETIVAPAGATSTIVTDLPLPKLPAGTWTRVVLRVDLEASGATATVTYGDEVVLARRPVKVKDYLDAGVLKVGSITDVNVTEPFTLRFDDVVVEHD